MRVAPLRCLVLVVLRITSWWSSENVCWWYFVCAVCLTGIQVDFAVSSNGSVISVPLDLFPMFVWPLSTFIQLYQLYPMCVWLVFVRKRGRVVCRWCVGHYLISFACYGLFSLRSFRGTCLSVDVWRYFSLCFVVCLILRSILFSSKCILIHSVKLLSFVWGFIMW